jgi:hypothetical protein
MQTPPSHHLAEQLLAPTRPSTPAPPSAPRYNPSWAYVDAIERYAGRIRRDPQAFLVFYARRLIVRTPTGLRRLN